MDRQKEVVSRAEVCCGIFAGALPFSAVSGMHPKVRSALNSTKKTQIGPISRKIFVL
jgi:hypothetical protein